MKESYLSSQKFYLAIPFFLVFVVNIFITQIRGLEFAGKLAIFSGICTFLSFFFSYRWDTEVLVKSKENLTDSIQSGILISFSVLIFCLIILLILHKFVDERAYFIMIIGSAALLVIYEILLNAFLKIDFIKTYVTFRFIPPLILFVLCINNYAEYTAWFFSLLIPAVLLFVISFQKFSLKDNLNLATKEFILKTRSKLIPTLSTAITNSLPLLWLLIIFSFFGDREAGIWINIYRIFSLPFAFFGAALLPYVLSLIGDLTSNSQKFNFMFKFEILIFSTAALCLLYSYFFGQISFSFLTQQEVLIHKNLFFCVIAVSFMQYSLQYWKEIFQSIERTSSFFFIMLIQLLFGISVYFLANSGNLEELAYIILFSTFIPFASAALLISYLYKSYKKIF